MKRKSVYILLVSVLLLSGCGSESEQLQMAENTGHPELVLREELSKYQSITYGSFQQQTGIDAEFYHANFYLATLADLNVELVFAATGYDEKLAAVLLGEQDKCIRIQGELGSLIAGITREMTVEEFANALAWEGEETPDYCYEEGAGTAYYVANRYVTIHFDRDGDGGNDAVLQVSLDESETIGESSYAWLCSEDVVSEMQ